MKISNQMGLRGKLTKLDKEILCNSRMAQVYFIVLLKTSPTYKGVDPPLAPPPTNKHVL